jgi:hypothetical protein
MDRSIRVVAGAPARADLQQRPQLRDLASCTSLHDDVPLNRDRFKAYDQPMAYLLIAALIGGLLMYLLCTNAKAIRIGEILLFSSILALLVALAPATIAKLHS